MKTIKLKKLILTITLAIAVGVFLFSAIAYAEDKPQYVPGEIIVKFKKGAADSLEQQITKEERAPREVSLAASIELLLERLNIMLWGGNLREYYF